MAVYTVLYGHFSSVSVKVGQTLNKGDNIGVEGETGIAYGAHCHIAVGEGEIRYLDSMRLTQLNSGYVVPNKKQCERICMGNPSLYSSDYQVSTTYLEKEYETMFGVKHPAIDVSATKKGAFVRWSLPETGRVVNVIKNDSGYGNAVMVQYTVSENTGTGGGTTPQALKKGDQVIIISSGKGDSQGGSGTAGGVGWKRQILQVHNKALYPYQVGDTTGTTGFYKSSALKKDNSSQKEVSYTVKSGDTLIDIAKKYNTTYEKLANYNGIKDPDYIQVGQKIKIPN